MPGKHGGPDVRFWRHVAKGDGCWEWQASRHAKGYGQFKAISGKPSVRAHRFSWVLHFGPIPAGFDVLHHCDNPPCVRPDHLFLGTPLHNTKDMFRKGRQHPSTERRGQAKLTVEQVAEIRRRYAAGGITMRALGKEYGVAASNIMRAISKQQWKDD